MGETGRSIRINLLKLFDASKGYPVKYYTFLTRLLYNAAMKKGILKEERVAKIAITAKRAGEEFDDYIVKKFIEKKEKEEE